jgi:phosphoglycerol transferase
MSAIPSAAGRIAAWVLPPTVVVLVVWLTLGGPKWDSRVPIVASGDALFYLAQTKSTLDHGWWWHNPSLGLPTEYPPLIFGQTTNVDQAVVWIVGRFTRDVGQAINVAWLVILGLGAVTATWGLRRLGVSPVGAGVAGVLFALTPYALYRHIGHFNLVTYLVPLPATAAVLLASARRDGVWPRKDVVVLAGACALVGFNYIYNAFFGAALIAAGVAIGYGRTRSLPLLKAGAGCLGALVLATALNFTPTYLAWRAHGKPFGTEHLTMESEYYGLKIRHLVSPVHGHWFPPFRAWLSADAAAGFPGETENHGARLGVIAATGWLGMMAVLIFRPRRDPAGDDDPVQAAARLSVVALLLATVGGLGSLLSLISPEIRAYNRISPFIAFLALAAVALWIDRATLPRARWVRAVVWSLLLAIGIADQHPPVKGAVAHVQLGTEPWRDVVAFVQDLEARLPEGAMVYQLPPRPYPNDAGIEKMSVYDHFLPYLASRRLRWSYPTLSVKQLYWEKALLRLPQPEWPAYLAQAGFQAVLIDRAGYADRGEGTAAALRSTPGVTTLADHARYLVLDLRSR